MTPCERGIDNDSGSVVRGHSRSISRNVGIKNCNCNKSEGWGENEHCSLEILSHGRHSFAMSYTAVPTGEDGDNSQTSNSKLGLPIAENQRKTGRPPVTRILLEVVAVVCVVLPFSATFSHLYDPYVTTSDVWVSAPRCISLLTLSQGRERLTCCKQSGCTMWRSWRARNMPQTQL